MLNYEKCFIILGYFEGDYCMWWNDGVEIEYCCFDAKNRITKYDYFHESNGVEMASTRFKKAFDV